MYSSNDMNAPFRRNSTMSGEDDTPSLIPNVRNEIPACCEENLLVVDLNQLCFDRVNINYYRINGPGDHICTT